MILSGGQSSSVAHSTVFNQMREPSHLNSGHAPASSIPHTVPAKFGVDRLSAYPPGPHSLPATATHLTNAAPARRYSMA